MQANSNLVLPLEIAAGVLLFALIWTIAMGNRLTTLKNLIKESWSNVDVYLQRRHDLIPNLVEVVKGYAKYEQDTLAKVIELRNEAQQARGSVSAGIRIETQLAAGLNTLLRRVEAYPDLKASQPYLQLQVELVDTEDRIAAARRIYNANVRDFNSLLQSFPTSMIGSMKGMQPAEYFEAEDVQTRLAPKTTF